ncbi:MAG: hypothetical protein QM703_26590 [Gemmatales bacterium]
MNQRTWLLLVTALIEIPTGLAFLCLPSFPTELLLGVTLTEPAAIVIARLAGLAILVIGIICHLARNDQSMATVVGMLIYNLGAAALLVYSGIALKLVGLLLWPAVVLHVVMAVWCMGCLRSRVSPALEVEET